MDPEISGGNGASTTVGTTVSNRGSDLSAFIDQGSVFEGKLSFKDTVRIDGQFKGEITSENTLIVGEPGEVEANIRSNTVIVSGAVIGDIAASRRVVLHKTARLQGNVEAASLVIEEGAILNGEITMVRPEARATATPLKAVEGGSASSGS
jgi:cytoskeletal protein CcmA (bactofilin family)